jgi:hypothetical protein
MLKHKLILPVSILLGSFILGSFYYTVQVNKQQFIEKEKLQESIQAGVEAKIKTDKAREEELFNKNLECQKLRSSAEKIAQSFDIDRGGSRLLELFYSPLSSGCVFSFSHANNELGNSARQYFKFYDLFSSKLLISKVAAYKDGSWDDTLELFTADVEKYK